MLNLYIQFLRIFYLSRSFFYTFEHLKRRHNLIKIDSQFNNYIIT
jgi:hypothetical protein